MEPDENPLDGNTEEVLAYAADHPDEVDALIKAEKAAAARKGVLEGLTSLAEADTDDKAEAKAAKKDDKAEAKAEEAPVRTDDRTDRAQAVMVAAQEAGEESRQATIAGNLEKRRAAQEAIKATNQN